MGNSVLLDPTPQYLRRRPRRLLRPQPTQGLARGVVHQVHQTTVRTALLEPAMKTSIQLYQFATMGFARPPLTVRPALAFPAPSTTFRRNLAALA